MDGPDCNCSKKEPINWLETEGGTNMLLYQAYVRQQRDALLDVALKALNRHSNQANYGLDTTLTAAEAHEVALYAEGLRNVPQQRGFPHDVTWPNTPACLRRHVIS